jgi:hypothetical protein
MDGSFIVEIKVQGGDMVISINGAVVSTVSDCELTEGPIGFQSERSETHWKSIRIRESLRTPNKTPALDRKPAA